MLGLFLLYIEMYVRISLAPLLRLIFCKIRHKETPRVHKETWEETKRSEQLCFKINTTMPYTEEYNQLVQELPFFQV